MKRFPLSRPLSGRDQEIKRRLARLVWRVRGLLAARGLLAVLAVAAGAVLTVMAVDAAVVLVHPLARWALSLAGLAWVAATAWSMLVLPLARPLTLTRMARVLETRHPEMQERISSALELAAYGGADAERASGELVALLTQDAKSELAGVRPRQEFSVKAVKPFLWGTAGVLAVLLALFAVWPRQSWLLFLRALAPNRAFDTLQASALRIKPGDVMRLAGQSLRFEVTAPDRHGLRAEIHFQRPGGRATVERMKRLSAQGADPVVFALELPVVDEGFEYRVKYGNAYTRPYTVIVVSEPRATETRVAYTYPAYTGLQPTQTVGAAQAITAVAGTRVRIESSFDRACAASLKLNALTLPNPGAAATNAVWLQTLSAHRNGRWTLALRDAHGFTNQPVWAAYTALPDQPPEVALGLPELSKLTLPPHDRLVCAGSAADDYGLSGMDLVIASDKRGERVSPLAARGNGSPGRPAHAELRAEPDLQALYNDGVRSFKLCFRVSDNRPPELGGPQVGESRWVSVTLKPDARTLREQVREAVKKEMEEQLRKAAQELHEAANRVAQEKGSFDKPELSDKAVERLEQARASALNAGERLAKAAQMTEKTPFAAFAKEILDTRDERVEPAFQKLEQIPLAAADKRRQAGDEAERTLREAAEKVNDLVNRSLQEENRRQEAQSRVEEVARREQALAAQAQASRLDRQDMQEWVNRQNETEQKMWQAKEQMEEAAFNKALEDIRLARDAMQLAQRGLTPEQEQAMKRQENAAEKAERAAKRAEEAASQALKAAEKAEAFAETRAASDAVRQAAEKTAAAAERAQQAAQEAQQAAEKRAANEMAADAAGRRAVAEQAARAAEQAQQAAGQAEQGAEQARQAAEARQAGQQEQAAAAEKQGAEQSDKAKETATQANAQAVEAARQADEQGGLDQAAEAGQLASESAAHSQRAADLAKEATAKSEAADGLPEAPRDEALKEARGLSEQSKQVAAEAKAKAEQAAQRAKDQLERLAREEQAAAARQAAPEAVAQQAAEAVRQAQDAVAQAREAVEAAARAAEAAQEASPLAQALAEWMNEAAALAGQAGELAQRSGERTAQAEAAELGEARERAETRQATAEAQDAARLAAEAAALARQTAQQAATGMAELKQTSAEAAQDAARLAGEAARDAQQAEKLAEALNSPPLQQAAQRGGEAAKLTGEAAALAQQAVQTAEQATPASDAQALGEAREGREKAQQALDLARQAAQQAGSQADAADAQQLAAAEKARQVADLMSAAAEARAQREAEAWALAQGRLGGLTRRVVAGGGAGGGDFSRRVPLNQDWVRLRGELGSEAYEEMLKKTPAEYRDLVKRYFEELSREGQQERK
jgi:hypothetical protein